MHPPDVDVVVVSRRAPCLVRTAAGLVFLLFAETVSLIAQRGGGLLRHGPAILYVRVLIDVPRTCTRVHVCMYVCMYALYIRRTHDDKAIAHFPRSRIIPVGGPSRGAAVCWPRSVSRCPTRPTRSQHPLRTYSRACITYVIYILHAYSALDYGRNNNGKQLLS